MHKRKCIPPEQILIITTRDAYDSKKVIDVLQSAERDGVFTDEIDIGRPLEPVEIDDSEGEWH